MTDSDYTHYVLIVDRSGSMHTIAEETQYGIRTFVNDQQLANLGGRNTLSLYQFDHAHDTVHNFTPLADVEPYCLQPRGSTALLDAIGFAVTEVGTKLAAMNEPGRPGKVVVVIATDGQENSSREYKRQQIKDMLTTQQEDYGWQVTYIGANQNSFTEAGSIGIPSTATMDYAATDMGTRSAWRGASHSTQSYVGGQSASVSYSDAQRTDAKDAV